MEWFNASNSHKPVVAGKSFADVIRANLGQKGHGQATPLVGTQVASVVAWPRIAGIGENRVLFKRLDEIIFSFVS